MLPDALPPLAFHNQECHVRKLVRPRHNKVINIDMLMQTVTPEVSSHLVFFFHQTHSSPPKVHIGTCVMSICLLPGVDEWEGESTGRLR